MAKASRRQRRFIKEFRRSPEVREWRHCHLENGREKQAWFFEEDAQQAALANPGTHAYPCEYHGWHIGHRGKKAA